MELSFWRSRLSEEDLEANIKAGFGARIGFGEKPALLNIDMTYMWHDPSYALGSGDMSKVLESVTILTQACREKNIPLFYCRRDDRSHSAGRGLWNEKLESATRAHLVDPRADEWPPEFAPRREDIIIHKNKFSAFFGTPLASMLTYLGVDTLIIVGFSTGACVRAAATDAFSYNLRPIVPIECVGDRCLSAHWANLFDMDMKCADVLRLEEILGHIRDMDMHDQ